MNRKQIIRPERTSVLKEYSRLAEKYDSKWSFYIQATTNETLNRFKLSPSDRLLDVGCGTGALLHKLSAVHDPSLLSGMDAVPEMLAIARRRLPSGVELREGLAEKLPYESEQFDIVVSCNMFHYILHPVAALREMRRVLRPEGQLVITDWCDDFLACRLCDLYLRLFNRSHFRIYRERDCIRLLNEAGHSRVEVDRYKINWFWGMMTACARKTLSC